MAYPFIDLEKTTDAKLIQHLAKNCGIEKEAGTPREQLIAEIIEFEELNNLSRPVDLLPADMRPTMVVEATANLPEKLEIPIRKHKRVKIKINEDTTINGTGNVYVRVNEYEALIKRNTEVEVPLPVYKMLIDAVETKGTQNADGSINFRDVPAYNVTYIGEVFYEF